MDRLADAFLAVSAEYALRISSLASISAFFDAGNVWARPQEIDPTRLFRGAGVAVQLVTPFGPIGLDYGYGFDKAIPGWQFHFKMGPGRRAVAERVIEGGGVRSPGRGGFLPPRVRRV